MLCQKCKKNKATTFITRTVNGVTEKYALCPQCAAEEGFASAFEPLSIGDLFAPLLGVSKGFAPLSADNSKRCPGCGTSISEIMRDGKAGCPMCYSEFYDRLLPSIERIHGHAMHVGKLSSGAPEEKKLERKIEDAEKKLKDAVENQNYEEAARLRDSIKEMKGENGNESAK